MDRTFKAFALFAKECPNAILLLHSDPDDNASVFHMTSLINKLGIQNRVIFTGMKFYKGFEYKRMNEVYNLMDVFLLTTSGEGFGIPTIEAMACEVPVLITDYTTSRELVRDTKSGFLINLLGTNELDNPDVHNNEILDGTIMGTWNVERGICSLSDAKNKLDILYSRPDIRIEFGKNGRKAVLADYNWELVGKEFIDRIEKLGGEY
jgi:glycosyltransferase involved in cell wall biosynthesis